jgi:hypothetical protein
MKLPFHKQSQLATPHSEADKGRNWDRLAGSSEQCGLF